MLPIAIKPYLPETLAAIDQAEQVFMEIIARTPESLGSDDKETLLMAFNSLVMEHFRAIYMLCRSQVATGSALALFRPLVDTVLRGQWLYLCASPEQANRFMMRTFDLNSVGFQTMAAMVDRVVGTGRHMEEFPSVYKQMSDYTHTGHDAVFHRLAEDGGIEPTYSEEKVRLLVTEAARITLIHFIIVCDATEHNESLSSLLQLFSSMCAV